MTNVFDEFEPITQSRDAEKCGSSIFERFTSGPQQVTTVLNRRVFNRATGKPRAFQTRE
jgi:hypothetical protein